MSFLMCIIYYINNEKTMREGVSFFEYETSRRRTETLASSSIFLYRSRIFGLDLMQFVMNLESSTFSLIRHSVRVQRHVLNSISTCGGDGFERAYMYRCIDVVWTWYRCLDMISHNIESTKTRSQLHSLSAW